MSNHYSVARKMPLEQISERKRTLATKGVDQFDTRERKAAEDRGRKIEGAAEDAQRRLRDKLGAKTFAALKAAQREERAAFARVMQPPGGLGKDRTLARAGYRRRMAAVPNRLGVDPKAIRDINAAANKKLDAALGDPRKDVVKGVHLRDNLAKWNALSDLHKFPLDWGVLPPFDGSDLDQFQVFAPPFTIWNHRANNIASDNFRIGGDYTLNEQQGVLGNIVTLDCNDAGSFDLAQSIVDTEVIFIYQAPRAGRVEVIIDAMNLFSHHDLTFEDEWGWSEHWTQQYHYLTLMPYHPAMPDRSLAAMSLFYKEGEDGSFSERPLTPGTHYYGHIVSGGAVQAGDTFFVGIGIRSFDRSRANDVEVHSRSNFQWLIRSVEIRVVP